MNNLLSYCGLVDARISASEKDLPVFLQMDIWIPLINVTHNYETDVGNTLHFETMIFSSRSSKVFFPITSFFQLSTFLSCFLILVNLYFHNFFFCYLFWFYTFPSCLLFFPTLQYFFFFKSFLLNNFFKNISSFFGIFSQFIREHRTYI